MDRCQLCDPGLPNIEGREMDRIDAVHVLVEVSLCVNEKKGSHHSRDIHVPLQIHSELHRVIHYYRDPSHSVDVDRDRKYP